MLIENYSFKNGISLEYEPLFKTRFVNQSILNYIIEKTHQRIVLTTPYYTITTFQMDNRDLISEINDIEKRVQVFLSLIRTDMTSFPIRIYWFPTPFTKVMPSDKKSLDVNEINSACTIHYDSIPHSYVGIYRFEEAKKVLFHELIHLFGLDRKIPLEYDAEIKKRYNLNKNLPCSLKETYSELMGCLLNIYYLSNRNSGLFYNYLQIEQAFSIYQLSKIFRFFGIKNINELDKLRSNTNLATYYLFKTAILIDPSIVDYFGELLKNGLLLENQSLNRFMNYIDNIELIPEYINDVIELNIDDETMRMTIVD
jgi:hypothetical protein